MQTHCRCDLNELNKRARGPDAYDSGVRGLPLQCLRGLARCLVTAGDGGTYPGIWCILWMVYGTMGSSVRRRFVAASGSMEMRTVPGLIAVDESYPTKQEFTAGSVSLESSSCGAARVVRRVA